MIKELLALLPDQQRKQLMFAFEQGIEQRIELEDGTLLGVNIFTDGLDVTEQAGAFTHWRKEDG